MFTIITTSHIIEYIIVTAENYKKYIIITAENYNIHYCNGRNYKIHYCNGRISSMYGIIKCTVNNLQFES